MISEGESRAAIAEALGLRAETVKSYMKDLYKVTGTQRHVALAIWVRSHLESPRDRIFLAFAEMRPAERQRVINDLVIYHQSKEDQ